MALVPSRRRGSRFGGTPLASWRGSLGLPFGLLVAIVIGLASILPCTPARAFDGERGGFVLGARTGLGFVSLTQELVQSGFALESERENLSAFSVGLEAGRALDARTVLSLDVQFASFAFDNAVDQSIRIAHGLVGVGLTKFLRRRSPSPYFTGVAGLSTWSAPFENDSSLWTGVGGRAAAGYEFRPHWSAELSVGFGNPGTSEGSLDVTSNLLSVQASLVYLAY